VTKDQHLTEQAKQECETAITVGNAGAAGRICLGLVYGSTGPYSESAAQYQLAVSLSPATKAPQ
jgi:5-enolpyruvylshikimate-3-phosphate synthase